MNSRSLAQQAYRLGARGASVAPRIGSLYARLMPRTDAGGVCMPEEQDCDLGAQACCAQCARYRNSARFVRRSLGPCQESACGMAVDKESVALALIEHQERLVLIRRTKAPLAGYWAPPAGHVEVGESVPQAVIREAREESGLDISLDGVVGVYSERKAARADSHMVITAFRSHSVGGDPVAGDDAGDIGLFARGHLPEQPPPKAGTSTDHWVYGVIQRLTADWR